jgi:hypothetical protein
MSDVSIAIILRTLTALVLLTTACKKEHLLSDNSEIKKDEGPLAGLAPGYPFLDGFFYCDVNQYLLADSSGYEWRISGLAMFNDSAKKIDSDLDPDKDIEQIYVSGNLNLGEVSLSEFPLAFNDYSHVYSGRPHRVMPPDTSVRWHVQGFADQAILNDPFVSPFPKINSSKSEYIQLNKSDEFKLEVSDYFSGYDSIWLSLPKLSVAKMKPGSSYVQYDARMMKYAYPNGIGNLRAHINASKYYYSKHAGRYYQYIFVVKYPIAVTINNK